MCIYIYMYSLLQFRLGHPVSGDRKCGSSVRVCMFENSMDRQHSPSVRNMTQAQSSFHRWRSLVVEGMLTARLKFRETAMLVPTNHDISSTVTKEC